jgi:hypothetical protein
MVPLVVVTMGQKGNPARSRKSGRELHAETLMGRSCSVPHGS